jgi:hypothetical protein
MNSQNKKTRKPLKKCLATTLSKKCQRKLSFHCKHRLTIIKYRQVGQL